MQKQSYGTLSDGREVFQFTLTNPSGMQVELITYGGIIAKVLLPDRQSRLANIVLGLDSLEAYETRNGYYGCAVGRYGNRIAKGRFTLDGKEYKLAVNNGENHLHGGLAGFDKRLWEPLAEISENDREGVTLRYLSADGEEGYPGNLDVKITYSLSSANELRLDYEAHTDAPTVVNLTNHSFWNLAGEGSGPVYDHILQLNASQYLPVDAGAIPLGEPAAVENTPFDFRQPKPIGRDIRSNHIQVAYGMGFDHNWIIDQPEGSAASELKLAAVVSEPLTDRTMKVLTTEPGVQFYSGNFLNATSYGTSLRAYRQSEGFCLETQHYPDSPNQPAFPSTVLRPGEVLRSSTIYQFGW